MIFKDFVRHVGDEWNDLWQLITQWLGRRTVGDPAQDVTYRVAALNLLCRLADVSSTLKLFDRHSDFFMKSLAESLENPTPFEEKRAAFGVIAALGCG